MKLLTCPSCGHAVAKAYLAKTFECPYCHARLKSNVVSVTNWEGVIAIVLLWIPFSLITQVVGESADINWMILVVLLTLMHFVVLTAFVDLEAAAD